MVHISAGTLLVGRPSLARAVLVLWCPSDHHHNQIHCTWVPWMIQCRVGAELRRFWKSGRVKSLMGGIEMLKCKFLSLSLSLSTSSLGQVVWPKTDRGIRNQLPRLLTHRLFTAKPNYAIWIGLRVPSQPNPRLSLSLSMFSSQQKECEMVPYYIPVPNLCFYSFINCWCCLKCPFTTYKHKLYS